MTSFHFDGQPLDSTLVASIARILDEANVPNVLWGNYLLTISGVPTIVDGAAFVVPDELLSAAYTALQAAGFPTCTEEHSTCKKPVGFRPSPPATEHLHIRQDLKLSLFKKSELLWALPPLTTISNLATSTDIILASNPRLPGPVLGRGRGAFPSALYPVRIPTAARYTEALILLLIRDRGHHYQCFWMAMMTYMLEYVDETDALREDDLESRFRPFYRSVKTEGSAPYVILDELGKEMKLEEAERR